MRPVSRKMARAIPNLPMTTLLLHVESVVNDNLTIIMQSEATVEESRAAGQRIAWEVAKLRNAVHGNY